MNPPGSLLQIQAQGQMEERVVAHQSSSYAFHTLKVPSRLKQKIFRDKQHKKSIA